MKEIRHIIKNKMGLHIRPASHLAALAREYHSTVMLYYKEHIVRANRIVEIMHLNIPCGADIKLVIEGKDEAEAYQALSRFCIKEL